MTTTRVHTTVGRLRRLALLIGGGAVLLSLIGAFLQPEQFFRGYLPALLFWLSIALGSLGLLMIYHIVGGTWGFITRRVLEAAALTIPLLALGWLVIVLGYRQIYPWANPGTLSNATATHRQLYLSLPFWAGRGVVYWLIWSGLAYLLNRWSHAQDQDAATSAAPTKRLVKLSPPGLILLVLATTFAWIDWVMSLEPDWYSTIFGMQALVGQGLAALSFALVVVLVLVWEEPFAAVLGDRPGRLNDLGNLLLTFVMLWAYLAFSQFLIIWYGNLPRETIWYRHRTAGGWQVLALALIVLHFAVPFILLLSRGLKRRPQLMLGLAAGLLVMHLLDLWWQVLPTFHPTGFAFDWQALIAPVAVGGLWLAAWSWLFERHPALAPHDPHMPEPAQYSGVEVSS